MFAVGAVVLGFVLVGLVSVAVVGVGAVAASMPCVTTSSAPAEPAPLDGPSPYPAPPGCIDEVSVAIFLDDHLPSCACTGHTRHDRADHSAALGHLLVVLRTQGAIAQPPVSTRPVDEELRRYDDHMDHVLSLIHI